MMLLTKLILGIIGIVILVSFTPVAFLGGRLWAIPIAVGGLFLTLLPSTGDD